MMQKTPRSVFIIGFVLAALINLVLFALIPHSSTPETPQPSPLRSQPVRFTPPSPQMEQPQPEEMTIAAGACACRASADLDRTDAAPAQSDSDPAGSSTGAQAGDTATPGAAQAKCLQ
ncbi:hypothetical protein [Desulfuromonas acetoxidans]|uniref:hypothetical protein n=1 Tax=Desulfuromonas acetoxidans TaxID=891 RepID=UPI00292D90C6|nr:hypothetical protein [Desulfuromonas acetoxidans]